jgi:hypothetical protein
MMAAGREGDEQRAGQERVGLGPVARADGLAREARGPHPQETEDPVEPREDDGADPDRADGRGLAHLAHDGGIDRAEDRDGHVRQHDGNRDVQEAAVRQRARGPSGSRVSRHGRA